MQSSSISRRKFLQISACASCGLLLPAKAQAANIRKLQGHVFINNHRATMDSVIRSGDLVTTSQGSRVSFTVNNDAFMLTDQTSLRVDSDEGFLINKLRLLTGKLLSVFETGRDRQIITANATIGIRGTACFLNAQPTSMYYCNCYGKTVVNAKNFNKTFEATHHNAH